MSELDKNKAGLHKQVSSVFKGVPVPQNKGNRQSSDTSSPSSASDVSPKPTSTNKQSSQNSLISRLSQAEDSPTEAKKSQTTSIPKKPTSTSQIPKSPPIKKISQPKESSRQFVSPPEDSPLIEESSNGFLQQIKDKLFTPKPGSSPAKQKAMVIMIPILAIIMIFVFRQVLSKSPRKTKGIENDDTPVVVSNAGSGNEIDWHIPEPITIIPNDPVQLPDETNTQNPEQNTERNGDQNGSTNTENQGLIIRDIVYSHDKPSAFIDSRIIYEGDEINGMTILKINRDSIEFEKDGKKWKQNVRDGKLIPLDNTDQVDNPSEPKE